MTISRVRKSVRSKKPVQKKEASEKGSYPGSVIRYTVTDSGDVTKVDVWLLPKAGKGFTTRGGDSYDINALFKTKEEALKASTKVFTAWRSSRYGDGKVEQIYMTWYRGKLRVVGGNRYGYRETISTGEENIHVTERAAVEHSIKVMTKSIAEEQKTLTASIKTAQTLKQRLGKLPADPKGMKFSQFAETKRKVPKEKKQEEDEDEED